MNDGNKDPKAADEFARSAEGGSQGFLAETLHFLRTSKKWWLAPIVIALVLLGALVIASGTLAGPFLYTLF